MFTISAVDMYYLHIFGVTTVSELIRRTVVYTIGLYIGFTLAAYLPVEAINSSR